jgi:alpha-D-xyloside xylohydrolase
MRGMFHEFPGDPVCWDLADQYMFGPDVLVAPVVEPHATGRRVYLPADATWTEIHTGAIYEGGQWLEVAAPISVIPVFAKNGALPELIGAI